MIYESHRGGGGGGTNKAGGGGGGGGGDRRTTKGEPSLPPRRPESLHFSIPSFLRTSHLSQTSFPGLPPPFSSFLAAVEILNHLSAAYLRCTAAAAGVREREPSCLPPSRSLGRMRALFPFDSDTHLQEINVSDDLVRKYLHWYTHSLLFPALFRIQAYTSFQCAYPAFAPSVEE